MRRFSRFWGEPGALGALTFLALSACSVTVREDEAPGEELTDSESKATSTQTSHSDSETGPSSIPLVSEALDCGVAKNIGGITQGTGTLDLERFTVDNALFPDAVCNDATPAIFYFRPAANAANANRWVIQLQGGGGCTTPAACAKRWCNVDTNFSMTQMTSTTSPDKTPPVGIFARRSEEPSLPIDNPIGDSNQVMIKYCSSDAWRGAAKDVAIETVHPVTGAEVEMRLHFQGQAILQATLNLLKRTNGSTITHAGTGAALPDLDDATEVILAGASAGGGGVTFNLDALAASLKAQNPNLTVLGLIDSTFGPEGDDLDYSASTLCAESLICSPEALGAYGKEIQRSLWNAVEEASCEAYHATDGQSWKCAFDTHVILNHLTTPFFVRQGLSDEVVSDGLVNTGVLILGQDYELLDFGQQVRTQFNSDLAKLTTLAEESASITVAPGGYAPLCSKHETLRSTADSHFVTIQNASGTFHMFDAWNNWRNVLPNGIVVHSVNGSTSTCQ